jgi:hypothetical protein
MMNFLTTVSGWFDGHKTYILCALAIVVVLVNHFWGPFEKLDIDPANWLNDIWTYLLIASGRSALKKIPGRNAAQ